MINVTRSIESYDSVFGIKQSVTLTGSNKPFDNELSTSESVRILRDWNNMRIEEMGYIDTNTLSIEGLKDIFDKIIAFIVKIIRAITDGIRKILGIQTKKENVKILREDIKEMHESERAKFISYVQKKLECFSDWFPNVDGPVFPDLSSYDVSHLKTVMNEINKLNSQFIKISEGIGLGPRATQQMRSDTDNMTQLLKNFEEKFLNNGDIDPGTSRGSFDGNSKAATRYMVSMLKLKPKIYKPNVKDPVSTFSILTDFVEKEEKFKNDMNVALLIELKVALSKIERSVKKMKAHLDKDKNYMDDDFKNAVTILSSTYARFAGNIHRVYVIPLMNMCIDISLVTRLIAADKTYHDDVTRDVGDIYESNIKKYEKKLF